MKLICQYIYIYIVLCLYIYIYIYLYYIILSLSIYIILGVIIIIIIIIILIIMVGCFVHARRGLTYGGSAIGCEGRPATYSALRIHGTRQKDLRFA